MVAHESMCSYKMVNDNNNEMVVVVQTLRSRPLFLFFFFSLRLRSEWWQPVAFIARVRKCVYTSYLPLNARGVRYFNLNGFNYCEIGPNNFGIDTINSLYHSLLAKLCPIFFPADSFAVSLPIFLLIFCCPAISLDCFYFDYTFDLGYFVM